MNTTYSGAGSPLCSEFHYCPITHYGVNRRLHNGPSQPYYKCCWDAPGGTGLCEVLLRRHCLLIGSLYGQTYGCVDRQR